MGNLIELCCPPNNNLFTRRSRRGSQRNDVSGGTSNGTDRDPLVVGGRQIINDTGPIGNGGSKNRKKQRIKKKGLMSVRIKSGSYQRCSPDFGGHQNGDLNDHGEASDDSNISSSNDDDDTLHSEIGVNEEVDRRLLIIDGNHSQWGQLVKPFSSSSRQGLLSNSGTTLNNNKLVLEIASILNDLSQNIDDCSILASHEFVCCSTNGMHSSVSSAGHATTASISRGGGALYREMLDAMSAKNRQSSVTVVEKPLKDGWVASGGKESGDGVDAVVEHLQRLENSVDEFSIENFVNEKVKNQEILCKGDVLVNEIYPSHQFDLSSVIVPFNVNMSDR